MRQELIQNNKNNLKIKHKEIRICVYCGSSKIDSYEFGISCEECGILAWRE